MMVKAVKGISFGNYATVQIGGQCVRITDANKDRAMDWFAEWSAPRVDSLGSGRKILVPIPSSKSTPESPATFRTAIIANKIAALASNTTVAPVLRFKAARPNAHEEGGSRSANTIHSELVLIKDLPPGQVILVDDVMTGGGHLIGSAWTIEDAKRTVSLALCCGRTTIVQLPDPFSVPEERVGLAREPIL
ncbi:hypothetical protein MXD81_60095 [Microbacteriaceae bacterium K1510]|nr:hypothetical protein [Microbacteriaceae bacterium K1510]